MSKDSTALLYDLFADLLEYPSLATPIKAGLCSQRLQTSHPEAGSLLERFYRETETRTLEQLEEMYTTTFDMQPVCYPYIGYQLFGESYKRGALMAQLNEAYRVCGYSSGQELPDHIAVVLRFLSVEAADREGAFCQALLNEGLRPALEKMLQAFHPQSENPYVGLLSALGAVLAHQDQKEFDHA